MSQPGSKRIEFLDSTRGLASMVVLLCHASGATAWPRAVSSFFKLPMVGVIIDGKAAVCMFFVLSGFVLSRPYVKSFAEPGFRSWMARVSQFYIKRITRIYFPFFCVLALSAIVRVWFYPRYDTVPPQADWFRILWSTPFTALSFLKQCFFQVHSPAHQLMSQDWSLGVELKASALIPFLLLALKAGPLWLPLIGCALLAFVPTGHYYFSFILGILLAAYGGETGARLKNRGAGFKWLLLIAAMIFYDGQGIFEALFPTNPLSHPHIPWVVSSIGCVLFLLVAFSSARLQQLLNHRTLIFLGRISYGVYLLHYLILIWIVAWLIHLLNRHGIIEANVIFPIVILITIGLTMAAATLFYKIVEAPSIQFGHSLAAACGRKFGLPGTAPKTMGADVPAGTPVTPRIPS